MSDPGARGRLRIGTRGSALALVQAQSVAATLRGAGADAEIVRVTTLGDRGAGVQDKSRWTSELERALADGRVDVAVHSAKDVPADLADGLGIVAVPPRADARDALCGGARRLEALPEGARVGTASLRRAAQVAAARDDLEVVELRGNVDSRLRKLAAGEVEVLVLALAGLQRLDRVAEASATLELDRFVPAAGQGALALQAAPGTLSPSLIAALDDADAHAALDAERTLVAALGASCHTPVGAHARRPADGGDGALQLTAWVGLPDGSQWLRDSVTGPADEVGRLCAERMLAAGARELLACAERQVAT